MTNDSTTFDSIFKERTLDSLRGHGLERSAWARLLQSEMHRLQYDLMRKCPSAHVVTFPAEYGSPSPPAPQALRCAYCATYFVPAGRSCGCGANRENARG